MSSSSPLYGIGSAEIVAELPTENGETRLLCFTTETRDIGKIGSLAPTRKYISNIAKYLGAITVAVGSDDTVQYEGCDLGSSSFDLTAQSGYHYTEYTHFVYTNGALINAGISNSNIGTAINSKLSLPYIFSDFGSNKISGESSCNSVIIPYSNGNETEFYYSTSTGKYVYTKDGTARVDMLTDDALSFDNLFILFADTVTYESASSSQMVMNTVGGGVGYYVTGGTVMAIRYEASVSGELTFFTESGEKLTINRGTSYIGFVKSSLADEVKIS
jgi:hypothetical protein